MFRIWLTVCLLVMGTAGAQAETFEVSVDLADLPPPAMNRPGQPFWNVPQQVERPGEARRIALPLLVLLPPDLAASPGVSAELSGCSVAAAIEEPVARPLYELSGGRKLAGLAKRRGDTVERHPMQREGAARLLPLMLYFDRSADQVGKREECTRARLRVTFQRTGEPAPERGHFLPDRLLRHVANPGKRALWYKPWDTNREIHDYVIVAREAYVADSLQLGPFLAWKEAQGFSPRLVTFEEIAAEMALRVPGEQGMERPEILRGWLQQHYAQEGFKYVLIIGSPNAEQADAIPMKQCWPAKEWEDPAYSLFDVPTDMYYADLTGNWNPDGDEFWCELEDYMELPEDPEAEPDGSRLDGVDLVPEVLVGRIPHFGKLPNYADGILERTMTYQQGTPEAWHNKVLLPSPQVCFPDGSYIDGSMVSKYLIENSLNKSAFRNTVLGEWDGNLQSQYWGDDRLDMFTMPEYYNLGYGTVFWCAHGNQEVAARNTWWYDTNANNLPEQQECEGDHFINVLFGKAATDQYPAVIFQASCLTADPSWDGNLTHTLLRNVSVANIASTRLTLGIGAGEESDWEPSPFSPGGFTLGVYFVHSFTSKLQSVATAFHSALNTLGYGMQPWTFKIRLEFNVYGDPSTRLPGCDGDNDCDDGNACNGLETCLLGHCHRGPLLFCPPDKPMGQCEEYGCDPNEGCIYRQKDNHTNCSDDSPCTLDDYCYDGECVSGAPRVCPPATKVCWHGYCEEASGACMFGPVDDGANCLADGGHGQCVNGTCSSGTAPPVEGLPDILTTTTDINAADISGQPKPQSSSGCAASNTGSNSPWPLLLLLVLWLCRRRTNQAVRWLRCSGRIPFRCSGQKPWTSPRPSHAPIAGHKLDRPGPASQKRQLFLRKFLPAAIHGHADDSDVGPPGKTGRANPICH